MIAECPESNMQDTHQAILAAKIALPTWRARPGRERARLLRKWHDLVLESKQDLATLITWENGKATPDAMGEVLFSASFLEWFSEEAAHISGDIPMHSNSANRLYVVKEPVGICAMITP